MHTISQGLKDLFFELGDCNYEWQPQTPDRLLNFRKDPVAFRPLIQWLGLGLPVSEDSLVQDGLSRSVFRTLSERGFVKNSRSAMSVSGSGDLFIIHDHWPPQHGTEKGYVHYGAESAWLARTCNRDLEGFVGKRVLDLGCGSGALMLEVAGVADEVLGLDISEKAAEWAQVLASAYGFTNIKAEAAAIGSNAAENIVAGKKWHKAVMNPPMVIPALDAAYPHRDGGKLGIELPLLFLDFAGRHLTSDGEVLCLITNPILHGKSAFFDGLAKQRWEFIERYCLHPHFNQSVARKQGYAARGIERVELWYLHLRKA
ncbi:MAG: methyltransferase domain-containing protein [Bdellovibrionota bacterium]